MTAVYNAAIPEIDIAVRGAHHFGEFVVPLDLIVNFNAGSTSAVTSVVDNSLHLVCFTSNLNTGSGTGQVTFNSVNRVRFYG